MAECECGHQDDEHNDDRSCGVDDCPCFHFDAATSEEYEEDEDG